MAATVVAAAATVFGCGGVSLADPPVLLVSAPLLRSRPPLPRSLASPRSGIWSPTLSSSELESENTRYRVNDLH